MDHATPARVRGQPICRCLLGALLATVSALAAGNAAAQAGVGHPIFASPHANPIAVNGSYVYVANTPADTVDVINRASRRIVRRIDVGVDPVSVAVRPDGREVWVANHVSDSVSVIDADPESRTFHQVLATVQALTPNTLATRFDEPVGIAFASDAKAYVALSASNRIAIVDVAARRVTGHLRVRAQDPRAIAVRGDRLYVVPFESNNQSQLSGCRAEAIDGEQCTFDAVEHVFSNNNVLSTNYDADIVKNPDLPDRDLFVFDTRTDRLVETVDTIGTLLYGLTVDSAGRVYVAQTDARNVDNGRAGTAKHGLAEMENRAFLNQITRVDCRDGCAAPAFYDLEPLPPNHPGPGMALATPFGIAISPDDKLLVATAAGSNKVFTMSPASGRILGRVDVGAAPRGVALVADERGRAQRGWVLNAVANTVSVVHLKPPRNPRVLSTITLDDPTPPKIKRGRIAFNDAGASTTGTFSCESCHPDNHTDQLLWVLETPVCDVDGCTQIPPRLTMPVRGLRDTEPYHWDGIPGDPYGGNNTASINAELEPNCDADDAASCSRMLVDGSLATTMCEVGNCPLNDEGKDGLLDAEVRDALAEYILSVPYPPAPARSMSNALTAAARDGFHEFNFIHESSDRTTGAQACGACHRPPFLVSTNTPGTGMDAPTWRGAYERWMILPQGRINIADLMDIVNMDDSFPERDIWILAGASANIWRMVVEGGTGFAGSFARQLTLNASTAAAPETTAMLRALEIAANDGAIRLQAEGVRLGDDETEPLALAYRDGAYRNRGDVAGRYSRADLLSAAEAGEMLLTLTGRAGTNANPAQAQPALWPAAPIQTQTRAMEVPLLAADLTLRVSARHIAAEPAIFVNGRRAEGEVACEDGLLPSCTSDIAIVRLDAAPRANKGWYGLHFLQLQNEDGLFSNELMFFAEQAARPRPGNLITSGGSFRAGEWDNSLPRLWAGGRRSHWNTVLVTEGATIDGNRGGEVNVRPIAEADEPWHVQLSHPVSVVGGREYTLCYRAKASQPRFITAYTDTNAPRWRNTSWGQHRADLGRRYRRFQHTFTIGETDLTGRVAFDLAQSGHNVQLDDIGLYEGTSCGRP